VTIPAELEQLRRSTELVPANYARAMGTRRRGPRWPLRDRRVLVLVTTVLGVTAAEALKITAGFGSRPNASQIASLAAVVLLTAWMASSERLTLAPPKKR